MATSATRAEPRSPVIGSPGANKKDRRMSTFSRQLWAMIRRNLLLKRRASKLVIAEIVIPCFFLGLFILIGIVSPIDKEWRYPDPRIDLPEMPFMYPSTAILPGVLSSIKDPLDPAMAKYLRQYLVGFAPNTVRTRAIMESAVQHWSDIQARQSVPVMNRTTLTAIPYETDDAMEASYLDVSAVNIGVGIVFEDPDVKSLRDTLRFPISGRGFLARSLPSTKKPYITSGSTACGRPSDVPIQGRSSRCPATDYMTLGFTGIQNVLAAAYTQVEFGIANTTMSLAIKHMPLPSTKALSSAIGIDFASIQHPNMLSSMLCLFVIFLVAILVTEKDKKHLARMQIMGLRPVVYYTSWVIIYAVPLFTFSLAAVLIAKFMNIYPNSDVTLLLMTCLLFGAGLIAVGFCIASLFKRPLLASLMTVGLIQAAALLSMLDVLVLQMTDTGRWALCLVSPVAFFMGLSRVGTAEARGHGIGWGNAFDTSGSVYPGTFSFGASLVMMTFDVVLYLLLAVYLEKVLPSHDSHKERPWFFLLPSYWIRSCRKSTAVVTRDSGASGTGSTDIEVVPAELHSRIALSIRNLRKEFPGPKDSMVAVKGFTYDTYEDEILEILGHNGAGKTTLINMVVGLLAPTSGTAFVYGNDITHSEELEVARTMIGICPQHDVLFDPFTVREHIIFYARLKGFSDKGARAEFERIIDEIGMRSQSDVQAQKLSGGQKRRLSIAIAVVGDPKILLLDEPTSGVDPYNRRFLWDMIQHMRQGRSIIITTQSMQEADVFADRKLIVSHGKLRCAGTSLFLKNRFGRGYHLTMSVERDFNERTVEEFVTSRVAGAKKARAHAGEISFVLPKEAIMEFPALFNELDQHLTALKIKTYGVSLTTMEEIFLKLAEEEDEDLQGSLEGNPASSRTYADLSSTTFARPVKGSVTNWKKFTALLKIRLLLSFRSRTFLVFGLIIPFFLAVIAGLLTTLIGNLVTDSGEILQFNDLTEDFKLTGTSLVFGNESGSAQFDNLISKLTDLSLPVSGIDYKDLLDDMPHYVGFILKTPPMPDGTVDSSIITFNGSAKHSIPYATNLLLNAVFRLRTGSDETFQVNARPFPARNQTWTFSPVSGGFELFLAVGIVMVTAVLGIDMCRDRYLKIRSQIRMTGCSTWLYWGSAFTVHGAQFALSFAIIIAFIYAFGMTAITAGIGCVITLFALNGVAVILFSYCMSFLFAKPETAVMALPLPMTLIGIVAAMAVSLMNVFLTDEMPSRAFHGVFSFVLPFYGFFAGMIFIPRVSQQNDFAVTKMGYFDFDSNIPIILIANAIHILIFILLIMYVESRHFNQSFLQPFGIRLGKKFVGHRVNPASSEHIPLEDNKWEDYDVQQERQSAYTVDPRTDTMHSIVLRSLRKAFGKKIPYKEMDANGKARTQYRPAKLAVNNISLRFSKGEIFGLLGPNGAGKTTTISMITEEVTPTSGDIHVSGYNMHTETAAALESMGSCPQTDTIWEDITVEEHLQLFGALSDLTPERSRASIKVFSEGLHITEHMKKRAGALSGGTKRKLTFIISMIGNPPVVLLDEPSTGMDPQSKRNLWDMIRQSFGGERGAILTTHSMEEADALCDRIGIIVKGQLQCLGSAQHLKDKFGSGYVLDVKLNLMHNIHSNEHKVIVEHVKGEIGLAVPGADCVEEFHNRLVFVVPMERITALGVVFANLDRAKQTLDLEEYSFGQTTIEQVFLHFAKMQDDVPADMPPIDAEPAQLNVTLQLPNV